jgi:hypothetical protein
MFALLLASAAAVLLAWSFDLLHCKVGECLRDDAAIRAEAFALPMVLLYVVLSSIAVFPAAIIGCARFGKCLASGVAAAGASAVAALVLKTGVMECWNTGVMNFGTALS